MLKCNVGKTERLVRVGVAIVAVVLGAHVNPWFYIVTVIALITAITGYCPVTDALGINTCKKK